MSYQTVTINDAASQRYYLAVVDNTGAEQVQYGKVEIKLSEIRDILAATTPTAVSASAGDEPGSVKFREVQFCLGDGTQAYIIGLFGGAYTKPA